MIHTYACITKLTHDVAVIMLTFTVFTRKLIHLCQKYRANRKIGYSNNVNPNIQIK